MVYGEHGDRGIGMVEVYDPDPEADSRLVNVSTRGFVGTGDEVLIGGFIAVGQESLRIIVRAIGPTINIPSFLANPTLELRDANGVLLAAK